MFPKSFSFNEDVSSVLQVSLDAAPSKCKPPPKIAYGLATIFTFELVIQTTQYL